MQLRVNFDTIKIIMWLNRESFDFIHTETQLDQLYSTIHTQSGAGVEVGGTRKSQQPTGTKHCGCVFHSPLYMRLNMLPCLFLFCSLMLLSSPTFFMSFFHSTLVSNLLVKFMVLFFFNHFLFFSLITYHSYYCSELYVSFP